MPINSSGDFAGSFWDLFNLYTLLGGLAIVLLFAFHGATYLTLRTTGELCGAPRQPRGRLSIAAAVVGAGFLVWTVAVAVDRNDKDVFPPLAARAARRSPRSPARSSASVRAPQRLGVRLDRAGAVLWRGHDLHEPLPAGHGLAAPTSPTASPSTTPPRRTTRWR